VTIEQAVENWISRCETKKHPCERSTVESYRRTMKLHVVPFIGKLKLAKLDTSALAKLEDQLRAAGRSALMVKVSLHFLSMMLKDAKRRGHCAQNVARDYQADASSDRKAERRARGRLRAGVDIPSRDEIRAIVTALDGRWRGIILTAVFTGLRSSEMRGLRWSCIDFAKSELHVRERVDQYGAFGKPKSAAGERTVPLPPTVLNTLRTLKLASPFSGDSDLVFPAKDGRAIGHNNLIFQGWQPAQVAAGVVDPMTWWKSDWLILLCGRESRLHGEAASRR
jgi:integrase